MNLRTSAKIILTVLAIASASFFFAVAPAITSELDKTDAAIILSVLALAVSFRNNWKQLWETASAAKKTACLTVCKKLPDCSWCTPAS